MAKVKGSATSNNKVTFGKRSSKPKKSFNKHDKKERNYRGQGR